jgi:hypothetical protein
VNCVLPHDDGVHFWWFHICMGLLTETMLPIGPGYWVYDVGTDSVAPSLSCGDCGTHGWWVNGKWDSC